MTHRASGTEKYFQAEAVILRQYEFAEADRLLVVVTAEHGKLRGIAKGVRKARSRMLGHCELFTRAFMRIGRGGDLYTISQAEQIDPYLLLREDLTRGAYAHYLAELIDRFTEYDESHPELYHLLCDALAWLATPESDAALVARYFEVQLLGMVGFQPSLHDCAVGQEPLEAQDQFFSVMDGGVVCPEHTRGRAVMPLSLTGLKLLRYMQVHDEGYASTGRLKVGEVLHTEIERILQAHIVHLLEMRLKTVEFIHSVRRYE
jgi:DNA repair protein RecO (recombination protein O)